METNKKAKNPEKMNVRDFITLAIMLVISFVVYAIVGTPFGMTGLGNLFIFAVCALVWGTIYMLYLSKVNKKGAVLAFGLLWAAMQLANFWGIALVIAICAVISEIIWRKLDRKKFTTMMICFIILVLSFFLGLSVPLMIFKDMYLSSIPEYAAELYGQVYELCVSPMYFAGIGATIAGAVAGSFIGKLILRKHFQKAGII